MRVVILLTTMTISIAYWFLRSPESPQVGQLKQELVILQANVSKTREQLQSVQEITSFETKSGLYHEDKTRAQAAMERLTLQGHAILPQIRKLAVTSSDSLVRARAKTVIGRITGQWGSKTDLVWERSLASAVARDKPILLLQLFGKFDEEFC